MRRRPLLGRAALALACAAGLVAGPVHMATPPGVTRIDVRSADYWRSALDVLRGEIDQFVALAEARARA